MKKINLKAVVYRLFMLITALVFAFNAQPLFLIPLSKPITAIADYSASTLGSSSFSSSVLDYEQTLTDNGDGTFTFKMDVGASYALDDLNVNCDISRNGYYTVKTPGDYLIQLWGGDGGNGKDKTLFKDGGEGGEGGYVYGTVSLEAGDVIYYALGGDGLTETRSEDGGGVNGDGGGHGDSGSFKVGGGGGYSAVYLFKNGSDSTFDEDKRKTNVIMIAGGGGGGGGAANLISADMLSKRTPDGGDGGNIETSASGTYDYNGLKGTFYAGGNGKSSGKSTKYVGIGGSDIPGLIPDTVLGWYEGSPSNDWFCEYHPDYEGGAGGSGNLRGGAGGAGLSGGSGGVMKSLVEAANIGGGGGGSSFISDVVVSFDKNGTYSSFYQATNNSDTGGALALKRLPDENENYDYLNEISISGEISRYFDIDPTTLNENITFTEGTEENEYHDTFTVTGSVKPDSEGKKGDILTIELVLKPKPGFHGGNNIPLFEGDFNCESQTPAGKKTTTIPLEPDTSNVNIPLTVTLYPVSKTVVVNEEYSYSSLHDKKRTEGEDWTKEFASITSYTLKDSTGNDYASNTGSTSHDEEGTTHTYDIECQLTPKSNVPAKVGTEAVARTFTATSYVEVVEPDPFPIAGYNVQMWKTLWHDGEYYNLKTNFKASDTQTVNLLKQWGRTTTEVTSTYTAPVDGYYYIQAWGGDGGKGGNRSTPWEVIIYAYGGAGGDGGYVSGYVYLTAGQSLSVHIGAKGNDGDYGNNTSSRTAGEGGGYTYIKTKNEASEDVYLLIAGGGGGGDKPDSKADGKVTFAAGADAGTSYDSTLYEVNDTNYSGKIGNDDNVASEAGKNYLNTSIVNQTNANAKVSAPEISGFAEDNYSGTSGAVRVTLLANTNQGDIEDNANSINLDLQQFTITEDYSEYFDVEQALTEVVNCGNYDYSNVSKDSTNNIITFNGLNTTATVTPTLKSETDYTKTYDISVLAEYSVTVKLKPKGGFLGGNDVDFLESITLSHGEESYSGDLIYGYSDTVNVAIDSSGLSIKPLNPTVQCGTAATANQLYTITQPEGLNDWRGEYVLYEETLPTLGTIYNTTPYDITVKLKPETLTPTAKVIDPVTEVSKTETSTAYVEYKVEYSLTNMRALTETAEFKTGEQDIYKKEEAESYVVTLIPFDGYLMPEAISVTGADNGWTFDSTTGILTIPKDSINNNITITAAGKERSFKVHYYYEYYIEGADTVITKEYTDTEDYYPGDEVTDRTAAGEPLSDIPIYPGYEYAWDWGIYDEHGKPVQNPNNIIMESSDMWVIGNYVPKEYNLTIEYGSPVNITVTKKVRFGQTYAVESEKYAGYLADKTVVTGTMPAEDVAIKVNYTPTSNNLNIVHIYKDAEGNIIDTTTDTTHYDTNEGYYVPITPPEGYDVVDDITSVSGTMTANGVIKYVYYTPKTITIEFDANGGNCATSFVDVKYNEIYGYNTMYGDFEYNGLPVAYSPGKTFLGWADESGQLVTEETIVTITSDTELTAQWKEDPVYSVTVNYYYANNIDDTSKAGAVISTHIEENKKQNMSYSIESPVIEGYVPSISVVKGTIGSEDVVVNVYYSDPPESGGDDPSTPTVPTPTIKLQLKVYDIMFKNSEGKLVDPDAPTLSGGKYQLQKLEDGAWVDVGSERTNTTGTIEWNNIDTKLGEGGEFRVISNLAPYGYKFIDPEDTVIELGEGDKTIIAFLNYSEELPFAGGASDVWLYTLGITFLVAAVGLWFADSKNKAKKTQN